MKSGFYLSSHFTSCCPLIVLLTCLFGFTSFRCLTNFNGLQKFLIILFSFLAYAVLLVWVVLPVLTFFSGVLFQVILFFIILVSFTSFICGTWFIALTCFVGWPVCICFNCLTQKKKTCKSACQRVSMLTKLRYACETIEHFIQGSIHPGQRMTPKKWDHFFQRCDLHFTR